MWAYAIKTGAMKYFERIELRRYVAPHNVRQCFHNDSCNARVHIMQALLQWNNCIYIAAYYDEIVSRNNKS